ncbi:MAG: response regulator [Proteobacteria bacterium]|nr:response regulator [Pseudomonadota bacterium]
MRKIILAVDDEECVLRSLCRLFRSEHYDFVCFTSPVEALAELKTIKPHIIISDNKMPHIPGVDFLSRAEMISQRSLRILLTGYTVQDDGCGTHIDRVMAKPWHNDDLEHEVTNTDIHHDKIIVAIVDSAEMKPMHECSFCGSKTISHEIRYDTFTEGMCSNCHTNFNTYVGSSMESSIFKHMIGNVF